MLNKIAGFFTKNAGNIGKALGILGAVWTIYSIVKGEDDRRKREAEQLKAKNNIIAGFNDIGGDVERDLMNDVRNFMAQNVEPKISACDEKIKSVEAATANEKIKSAKLSELLTRTENLIGEIQACK